MGVSKEKSGCSLLEKQQMSTINDHQYIKPHELSEALDLITLYAVSISTVDQIHLHM